MAADPEPPDVDPAAVDRRVLALERPDAALMTLYFVRSLAGLFLFPFVLLPLYFRYHTLRYRFDTEGVSASWGILFKREIHLTYKRLQDIHVRRNLVERWLGIATVALQTASGSQEAELSIEGVRDYEGLRDFLYRRMRGHDLGGRPADGSAGAPAGDEDRVSELLGRIASDLEAARAALERGA
jgi:putative membrane protein